MTAPETAYAEVERLVNKFKTLPAPRRRTYNGATTRQDFILPLFGALGWNTADSTEVSLEEKVSRGWFERTFGGFSLATSPGLTAQRWEYRWREKLVAHGSSDRDGRS